MTGLAAIEADRGCIAGSMIRTPLVRLGAACLMCALGWCSSLAKLTRFRGAKWGANGGRRRAT